MTIPGRDTPDPETPPSGSSPPSGGTAGIAPPPPPPELLDAAGGDYSLLEWNGLEWRLIPPSGLGGDERTALVGSQAPTAGPQDQTPTTPTTTSSSIVPSSGSSAPPAGGSGGGGGSAASSSPPTPATLNVEGATLISVGPPGPTRRWYAEWTVHGVTLRHVIGDDQRAAELGIITLAPGLGPIEAQFATRLQMSQWEFNAREAVDVGLIDERLGVTESYQQSIDRQLRIFGQEDLPDWQRDPEVMTILMTAAAEGFSPGRTLGMVVETSAFKEEHPFFDQVKGLLPGQSLTQAYNYYTQARDQIRQSIRTYRGTTADDYAVAEIMAKGWDPEEVEDVLIGEAALRAMPGAVDQINAILEYQGLQGDVTDANLLDLIRGVSTDQTPMEFQELINDALRAQALENQGIDISPALAEALGTGESFETLNVAQLQQIAIETAQNIFRFGDEIRAEREGITRDDLVRAAFGEPGSADVNRRLAKFARRRQLEAQGFAGTQSFTDETGNLRLFGFGNL